jgi:hypothetical protein
VDIDNLINYLLYRSKYLFEFYLWFRYYVLLIMVSGIVEARVNVMVALIVSAGVWNVFYSVLR